MTAPLTRDEAERRIAEIQRQFTRAEVRFGSPMKRAVLFNEAKDLRAYLDSLKGE